MRRRAAVALALTCAVAVAGCGGGGGSLGRPLSYLPAGTPAVALVKTDLDDTQWHAFNGQVAPLVLHVSVRRLLRETADQAGLSFGDDLKPLLGNPLVVGVVPGSGVLAALQLRQPDRADRVLRALGFAPAGRAGGARLYRPPGLIGGLVAVDGDVLVGARRAAVVRRALADHRRGGRLTEREVRRGLNGLPGDALLRVYGNLRRVAARAPARLRWARALRTYGVAVTLKRHVIEARAVVRVAARAVDDAQLPLATGPAPAPIPLREDAAVAGLRQAAPTAAFALAALGSRASGAAALLGQLAGPAFAASEADGDVTGRAGVRDPAAAARALRALAARRRWRALGAGLYRPRGLPGVIGLVGGALALGPDGRRARQAAGEPTVGLTSTHGALVARADLAVLAPALARLLRVPPGSLDEAVAFVKADRGGLRAVARIGVR